MNFALSLNHCLENKKCIPKYKYYFLFPRPIQALLDFILTTRGPTSPLDAVTSIINKVCIIHENNIYVINKIQLSEGWSYCYIIIWNISFGVP